MITPKMQIFEDCFSLKTQLVTSISQTRALISSKDVAEDTKSNLKQSKPDTLLWSILLFLL